MFGMGNQSPRQEEGEQNRADLAANGSDSPAKPPLTAVPDLGSPFWTALGVAPDRPTDAPPEGPGATFAFADFDPATEQLAILADPAVTRLASVTTQSAPDAPITLLRLDFRWVAVPTAPGYSLHVMVAGQHHFTAADLRQIAPPAAAPADWISLHTHTCAPIAIAAPGHRGLLHLIEVSQIYDKVGSKPNGGFTEHCSRFYIYAAPDLDAAAILAPFADEDWRLLAKLPGVAKVFEVILPPRDISPESDAARDYPLFITDRDLASRQSLNYHY